MATSMLLGPPFTTMLGLDLESYNDIGSFSQKRMQSVKHDFGSTSPKSRITEKYKILRLSRFLFVLIIPIFNQIEKTIKQRRYLKGKHNVLSNQNYSIIYGHIMVLSSRLMHHKVSLF